MAAADVRNWSTTLEPNLTKVTTLDPGRHTKKRTHVNRIAQRVNRIDQRVMLTDADANLSTTSGRPLTHVTTLGHLGLTEPRLDHMGLTERGEKILVGRHG